MGETYKTKIYLERSPVRDYVFGSSFTRRAKDIEVQVSKSVTYAEKNVNKDNNEIPPFPENDWFVLKAGAVPEATYNWFQLLHDTHKTNFHYKIELKRLSFDYLPQEVLRPLASADLSDFLLSVAYATCLFS